MCMKNSNRTATSSRMTVFDIQGRFVEFPAKPAPDGLAAIAQKPVAVFVENEYLRNQQLHNSVLILGSEEIFPKANLLPVFTFNRSRQGRSCISVSKAKQPMKFKHRAPTIVRDNSHFGSI